MTFQPTRLRMARGVRGMEREALAKKVGLTEWDLWLFEKGEKEPSASELIALGLAVDFPVGFFARDLLVPEEDFHLSRVFFCPPLKPEVICEQCKDEFVEALCDFPMQPGKTCDKRLGFNCRNRVSPTKDMCGPHFRIMGTPKQTTLKF